MDQGTAVKRDRFFAIVDYYLLPLKKLERVTDSTYFLRKNLGFAFAQGYCHPAGGFYGKLINYPDPAGAVDIFGHRYTNTTKRMVNGNLELIPIDEQLRLNFIADPALMKRDGLPPFAEYHVKFSLDECIGFFDHRYSLKAAMEMYPWLSARIASISAFLGIPQERLGATGSTAYGKIDPGGEDIDLIIYGSVEEHQRVLLTITEWLRDARNRVFEFGRYWPMRFYYDGTLVCPFFIYARQDEIPLADFTMAVVQHNVQFRGRVCDDLHSIYLPSLLGLEDVSVDAARAADMPLIIYDSSMRGEFRREDLLEGRGALVDVRQGAREYRAILVTMGAAVSRRSWRSSCGDSA
jgi:hypothetical protein